MPKESKPNQKKVAIIHPDLGIGGAENLIINIALALESKDYKVKIFTPYFDPDRCFEECHSLDIEVHGNLWPRTIFGRFIAYCAYIRCFLCALWIIFWAEEKYDYFILDQVSTPMPLLRLFYHGKIMFYCHHPDKLLCTNRESFIMKFYRYFMDLCEEITTSFAQTIVVNSEYTQHIFLKSFPIIAANSKKEENDGWLFKKHNPEVLYPAINLKVFDKSPKFKDTIDDLLNRKITAKTQILTSLNRYERKKNINLAIKGFADFMQRAGGNKDMDPVLVIAGGWDARVAENVEHEQELRQLAIRFQVQDRVVFLKSISNDERLLLLENTSILLYTPENEHFGIVPVEAMHMGCIVLACNSGGPLESVADGETGYLQPPVALQWGEKIHSLLDSSSAASMEKQKRMKVAAKQRVLDMFTMDVFANRLDDIMKNLK